MEKRKEGIKEFWKKIWNEHAESKNMFVQIGRSSYTPLEFFLMVKDISNALKFEKNDIVLDAGGGAAWISIAISPFAGKIYLFDYADKMMEKAKENIKHFDNIIEAYVDDIEFMGKTKGLGIAFDKIIISSVLQYFSSYDSIRKILRNIFEVLKNNGKAIVTHNPNIAKKKAHIKSYHCLNWDSKRIQKALEMEEKRFWMDIKKIKEIASKIGFTKCCEVPINSNLWQSTHMFDFLLQK